jgi:hypothetical protein
MNLSRRLAPTAILLPLVLLSLASLGATQPPAKSPMPLTVHEWGTFTSVAGPDGRAIGWTPLDGADDLPCFVDRYYYNNKGTLGGTVRMETPVLYFYGSDETAVNVNVRFRGGAITEWYPRAAVTPRTYQSTADITRPNFESTASWTDVRITPDAIAADLPSEKEASHYYLARRTDAAPVRVGVQREKFLFYRGIGSFQPPIAVRLGADGTISVKNPAGEPLGDLVLFENRGGKIAYQVQRIAEGDATLTPPILTSAAMPPTAELEQMLLAHGLFPREAKAMVDTWRDSWFEEGARLFYIASRRTIEAILPLEITPAPSELTRAFVGRVELITTRTEQDVRRAMDAKDQVALAKYGRFLTPITDKILAPMTKSERTRLYDLLVPVYRAQWAAHNKCAPQPRLETRTTQSR